MGRRIRKLFEGEIIAAAVDQLTDQGYERNHYGKEENNLYCCGDKAFGFAVNHIHYGDVIGFVIGDDLYTFRRPKNWSEKIVAPAK